MSGLSNPLLLAIFVVAAGVIWIAGIQLSEQTDVLATRLHLGSALGGLILLALATNLPEIAIVGSAPPSGGGGGGGGQHPRGGAGRARSAWRSATSSAGSRSRRSSSWRWTPSASARAAR